MKKFFIFAFALVASVLVFTACEGKVVTDNEPDNTEEANINKYIGSMWYLDSIDMGDFTSTHMCMPIFVLSKDTIRLGNDVELFRYEENKIYLRDNVYDIVSLDEKGIVLSVAEETIYISALPVLDPTKQIEISESALIGRYKQVISSIEETSVDGSVSISYSTGGLIMWINLKLDRRMTFEDSNPNMDDTEGFWAVSPDVRLITWGGVGSYDDLIGMNNWQDILVFNEDYLVVGEDYDYDGTVGFTHRHYENVFVRVEE